MHGSPEAVGIIGITTVADNKMLYRTCISAFFSRINYSCHQLQITVLLY